MAVSCGPKSSAVSLTNNFTVLRLTRKRRILFIWLVSWEYIAAPTQENPGWLGARACSIRWRLIQIMLPNLWISHKMGVTCSSAATDPVYFGVELPHKRPYSTTGFLVLMN